MMVKNDYLLICENAFADPQGRNTIVNIFNIIYGSDVPLVGPDMMVAFAMEIKLDSTSQKLKASLSVQAPSGKELVRGSNEVILNRKNTTKKQGVAGGIKLTRPVFEEFGTHKFTLILNGKKVATRNLEIQATEASDER